MGKRVHAFDIDGVVTTSDRLIESIAKEYSGFTPEELTDYSIAKCLLDNGYIGFEHEFNNMEFFNKYGTEILAGSEVHEGFLDYYKRLVENGDEVHFITARREEDEGYTEKLFKDNGIPYVNVHHMSCPTKKGRLVESLGVTDFYEDNFDTALGVAGSGEVNVIVVDALYNRKEFPYRNMQRINSWGEL